MRSQVAIELGAVDLGDGSVAGRRQSKLTPTELRLFALLAGKAAVPFSTEQVLSDVWPGADAQPRTLYSTMDRLRKKVERDPVSPVHLLRHGTGGYVFIPLTLEDLDTPFVGIWGAPAPLDVFIGRNQQLARLHGWLLDPAEQRPVTIEAPRGVGTSRLLLEFACIASRSGQVARVRARGVGSRTRLIEEVASIMRLPAASGRLVQRVARVLTAKGVGLLILDGLEEAIPAAWRDHPRLKVVTTGPEEDAIEVELGPLDEADGLALLECRVRGRWPRWAPSQAEWAVLGQLANRSGGRPLELELTANALFAFGARELLDRLAPGGMLSHVLDGLDPSERARLVLLSGLPTPIQRDHLLHGIGGRPELLGRWRETGLISAVGQDLQWIDMPHAVRDALTDASVPSGMEADCGRRHAAWLAGRFGDETIETLERTGRAPAEADHRRFRVHLAHAAAQSSTDGVRCRRAAVALLSFDALYERAVELAQWDAIPAEFETWFAVHRAGALRRLGRHDASEQALQVASAAARGRAEIDQIAVESADLFRTRGDLMRAELELRRVLDPTQEQTGWEAVATSRLATVELLQGRLEQAVQRADRAMVGLVEAERIREQAVCLGNQAVALRALGRFERSEDAIRRAIQLCREIDAPHLEAGNLTNLAGVQVLKGQPEAARATLLDAVSRLEGLGSAMELAVTQNSLAMLAVRSGDLGAARQWLEACSDAMERLAISGNLAHHQLVWCVLLRLEGQLKPALQALEFAADRVEKNEHIDLIGWVDAEQGHHALGQGDRAGARTRILAAREAVAADAERTDARWAVESLEEALAGRDRRSQRARRRPAPSTVPATEEPAT